MNLRFVSLAAVFLGLLLVLLSAIWPSMFASSGWTDQQASELISERGRLHGLEHKQGHAAQSGSTAKKEMEQLNRSLEEARRKEADASAQLESAIYFRNGVPGWLKWIGAIITVGGAAGVMLSTKDA
jgi:hypothetical protein